MRIRKYIRDKVRRRRNGREPNALIFVDSTRKCIKRRLPQKKIPMGIIPRDWGWDSLYILNLDRKRTFRPIIVPKEISENKSPKDLWYALNCEQEVNEAYHMPEGWKTTISYVVFFVLIFAELVVLFLIASSAA